MPIHRDPQAQIDAAIRRLGGYWAPLAGLARVLEELGELASAQTPGDRRREAVDCVVACVAVANQYAVRICAGQPASIVGGERDALIWAGQLSRIVNRIEGAKPPKPLEQGALPLQRVLGGLVGTLASIAGLSISEILEDAAATAAANAERDKGRFIPRTDAVTAASRDAYLRATGILQSAPHAGVWGVDAMLPEVITAEALRFLRLDAIHPMQCLVSGPFHVGDPHQAVAWEVFMKSAPAGAVATVKSEVGTFIRLSGSVRS